MRIDVRPELIMVAGTLILAFSLILYARVLRNLAHLGGLAAHWRIFILASVLLLGAGALRLAQVWFSTRQIIVSPLDVATFVHRFGALEAALTFLAGALSLAVGVHFLVRMSR
jgi:hypothetical protein